MTQQNLQELLKQGDPDTIASSINRTLQPKGIKADVTRDNGCLHIILESSKVPSQMALVDFIRNGMTNLGVESIHTVKVYGRRTGDGSAAWEDEINLMPEESLYPSESGIPDDSIGLDDVEPEDEDYYQESEFDRDDGDEDEDEDEHEDIATPAKKQFPKWVIPVGILVPVVAIAGLYFTGNLPFGGSNPEPSVPEAASPSPKASSGASKTPTAPSPNASGATPKPVSPVPKASPTAAPASPAPTSPAPKAASPAPKAVAPKPDPWREGVNNAQKAAVLAQTAQSQNEWIAVASEWQKAVGLMRAVPSTSPNYQKAQQKATEYQANLIVANRRAAAAP
ncbi:MULTISPECIES: hypothetical protein [unclassified Microcoleus]|uniref:hypothetical protein n=1 Tax=unclassified Microcoleus TaxID=2642155 RepID=UPI002FD3F0D2